MIMKIYKLKQTYSTKDTNLKMDFYLEIFTKI